MEPYYNRRERRNLAKNLGLNKRKLTAAEKSEQKWRALEAGKQIHQQFIMSVENETRSQMADMEARQLNSFTEAFGEEAGTERFQATIELKKQMMKKKNRI